jgi:hypothetical protein
MSLDRIPPARQTMWSMTMPPEFHAVPPRSRSLVVGIFLFVTALAAFLLVTAGAGGCGYGGKACQVIDATKTAADAASSACTMVKYLAPDGTEKTVAVSPAELRSFGLEMEAKRLAPPSASASAAPAR